MNNLVKKIYRKSEIKKIEEKLLLFGKQQKITVTYFMNLRLFSTLLLFILLLLSGITFIYIPVITILYYYLVYYIFIEMPLKKRTKVLERESYYFFEVMTLSLESGRNLEVAIEMSCNYIKSSIADEFLEILHQIKFGKSLGEALDDMKKRIPSESINNIILNIRQSNMFGNSIIDTMYNQLDFLRDKQVMNIRKEIARIPTKISILSVLFFIPLMMLLVLSPILLEFILNR